MTKENRCLKHFFFLIISSFDKMNSSCTRISHPLHSSAFNAGVVSPLSNIQVASLHVLSCLCRTISRRGTTPLSSWWTPSRRSPSSSHTLHPRWVWRHCIFPPPSAWTSSLGYEDSMALKTSRNPTTPMREMFPGITPLLLLKCKIIHGTYLSI